jgi:hypothetical protein
MENTKKASDELSLAGQAALSRYNRLAQEGFKIGVILKKLRGGFLLVIGFLLSPLSFWNDLFFNLPIAYFLGMSVVCFPQIYSCLAQS